ncbi:MAG: SpoIIE family protein phosphatase, partial [Pseudobdellovibrionaceae bacterium]
HGGKVAVRSEYGKGTTFEFSFPVGHAHLPTDFISNETEQEDQDASNTTRQVVDLREGKASEADLQEVNARNKQVENSRDPYKPTLLYVDDNKDLREFVSGILASQYNLFLGVNGRHGLEAALNYAPDLILSDLMMPEMNGGEFLKAAKENVFLSSIPFVILTAKLGSESKISELERGADDYLNKPFSEAELVARLSNLIKIRTQQQRIKKDLIAARQIQQSLLPPAQLHLDSCELEVLYHPCEELSGDFFDIYETPDFIYYYVADVTSHGTAAAQVTYLVKGLFENQVMNSNDLDLKQLLGNIAKKYVAYNLEYAVGIQMVKLHKKSKLLEYSSSNAPSAYLLSKAKKPETIFVDPGPALWTKNYSPDREFSIKPIQLAPGDSFFCFTDGVYEFEMENGKEFGERRLQMALQKSLVEPKWTECLMEDLRKATGGSQFPDDITAVRLKIKN